MRLLGKGAWIMTVEEWMIRLSTLQNGKITINGIAFDRYRLNAIQLANGDVRVVWR